MSYARFAGEESVAKYGGELSDVYVYLDEAGYFSCCGCRLADGVSEHFASTADLIAHLRRHTACGDAVPSYTIPSLEAEARDNDSWLAEKSEAQR